MLAQKVCWRFDVDPTPSIASFIRQKLSVKYWLKRFARDLVWIQHLALHLVIMIKIFSVITLTQNAIKGAWKGLRRCHIRKTSLNHPKLYSMFAILQCHALKVLWWSQSLKIFMRLSSSRADSKLKREAAFAVMLCASLPSSNKGPLIPKEL